MTPIERDWQFVLKQVRKSGDQRRIKDAEAAYERFLSKRDQILPEWRLEELTQE